jgi:DNA helicase-2/ATP-dependent DNA helicase PcrA
MRDHAPPVARDGQPWTRRCILHLESAPAWNALALDKSDHPRSGSTSAFQYQHPDSPRETVRLVTTYHSSKGREFDTVILPGLLNGILPHDVAERGRWRSPSPKELAEQRRSFYVALTRAEHSVRLIVGPGYHTKNGYWISKGPSSLVVEMAQRLNVRSAWPSPG